MNYDQQSGPTPAGASRDRRYGDPDIVNSLAEQLEDYKLIFDSIYNGVMVTDADGYVTHFSRP
jgi:hypothetical protein